MGTTTELNRVVPDSDNTDFFTVFFTKEGHGSHFFSSIDICFNRFDCDRFPNFFIDLLLNSTQFFWSYSLKVSEVETQEFLFVKRTSLNSMITDDVMKGSVQEVSRCVVLHDTVTTCVVNFKFVVSPYNKFTFNFNSVKGLSIWCTLNINNTRNDCTSCI